MATTVEASTLTVAWDASADPVVVGYRLSFGVKTGVYTTDIDTGTQTVQVTPNLTAGATYYFVVRAYDRVGTVSGPSGEISGVAPLSSPLQVTCPAPVATSINGAPVAVTFSATATGGLAPLTTTCTPASGSNFAVGATSVLCTAKDTSGVTATCTGSVVVTAAGSVSANGTHVPPATQIVDATGVAYTLKTMSSGNPMIMRNGVQLAGGFGTALAWCTGQVYALGDDSNWWKSVPAGSGFTWSAAGSSDPCPAVQPPPPPPVVSPSGTHLPPAAQILDTALNVYTLKAATPFPMVMRNGSQFAGAFGTAIAWCNTKLYVKGDDGSWWQSTQSGSTFSWASVGGTDPCQ